MKKKTQGTITSIFGVIFLLIATTMFITNYFFEAYNFTYTEMITMLGIGYAFLMVKDDVITSLLPFLKSKEKK